MLSAKLRECRVHFLDDGNAARRLFLLAGGLGFEPRLTESESAVLPLNYPPIVRSEIAGRAAIVGKSGALGQALRRAVYITRGPQVQRTKR